MTTAEEVLTAAKWQIDQDPDHTDYKAPDGLRRAGYLPDRAEQATSEKALAWEFTAHPALGAHAAWTVRFARDTPPEIAAAFAAALADDTPGTAPEDGPRYLLPPGPLDEVTNVLAAAGWMRDIGRNDDAWYAPDGQAVMVTAEFSDAKGGANWLCAVRHATDRTVLGNRSVLWFAVASPATPTHLMAALSRALTDPTPVPRYTLPSPGIGAVTITSHP
ncbi:DUF317 domain-containing protein [Streptomyces malaysiensis]|uniref:DUF317 domain-containing protein n=1 Tax=Streptomyces malaysiensis TaxID=92644 RepID=UPI0032204481|nr:DUF317 domain-containing protein [Streptomyces malaysiensis]